MTPTPEHLLIAPILLPLLAGALMLFYEDRRAKRVISLVAAGLLPIIAFALLDRAEAPSGGTEVRLYLLGDWPSPFAIVLVLDRLSALMLVVTSVLALPALVFAVAGWDRQGQHFHSLFQFLLMGLNGAFLTGDLFNLFVFFEVLLAASYGLMLHGSGPLRVRAGLHYIAINLAASLLFLIGVSLIYGVTGTLNMADLAVKAAALPEADRGLLRAGAAALGIAFLVKAAMWPLCFWLPITYMAAAPPVAAIFAIMSKVGVYAVLRVASLAFGAGAAHSAGLGAELLVAGGMATIAFGMFGVLASQGLGRLAGCSVLVSTGTFLAAIGMVLLGGGTPMLAGALYYMVSSSLALSALFLMADLIERNQGGVAAMLAVTAEAYGFGDEELDADEPTAELALPGTMTVLGLCFGACALLLAGLPPLSGFVGKFALLSGMLNPGGLGAHDATASPLALGFTALVIFSGLAALVALLRVGIQTFWVPSEEEVPKVLLIEIAPILALLAVTLAITVEAQPVMRYMQATAAALHRPEVYVEGVLGAPRVQDGEEAVEE
ncbi:monovalent cation/H+ antiporter subunit D [Amaricoccus sp.]|uniref:monovalent cation/H+ antiporter subunit D n=1 Tax=Amaricoccus sp. TaxID=1872485 RepID=UPI0026286F47|nr:monovalent cation/H+ antiporter subunit D [Amaricoccus sp.]HRO10302.1 monovalent cation/H+ antiporter subunit D [Amaricoccus sp.]